MNKLLKTVLLVFMVTATCIFFPDRIIAEENPSKLYVLIVCGWNTVYASSFNYDTAYAYHVLSQHYICEDINYLSTYPQDPGVNQTATKDNVRTAINTTLASKADFNDIVFIYISTHGGGYNHIKKKLEYGRYNGTQGDSGPNDEGNEVRESTLDVDVNQDGDKNDWVGIDESILIGNETYYGEYHELYWDDELKNDLDKVNGTVVFVRQGCLGGNMSCFQGGLIDDLSDQNRKRIIMSSSNETYYSTGDTDPGPNTPGDLYSEWTERFFDALHGVRAYANRTHPVVHTDELVDADSDDNGQVSLKEAWDWAWNNDEKRISGDETPWFDDDGDKLPTYKYEADYNDTDGQGILANQTFLPLRGDLGVDKLDPIEHYPIFQVFNGTMYNGVAGNNSEITMRYSVTVSRRDNNNPPSTVYANITLRRTRRDNSSDCSNITTVVQSFAPGQTQSMQMIWNESQKRSMKSESAFWNISCFVEVTTPGWYDVNLVNNEVCNDTVEGRYLVGDANGDGVVDVLDAITLACCYGKNANQTGFNPLVNFQTKNTESGLQIIDIYDAILLADNFGKDIYDMAGARSSQGGTQSALLANTALKLEPSGMAVFRGETFTVDVKLTDVVDLYGWEFKLYWNRTVLNCTNVTVNIPSIWQDTTQEYGSGLENSFNATHGRYFRALTPTDPAPSFNGSMTLATFTFKATETGTTQLLLQDTKLGDKPADPITHSVTSGSVDVYHGRYMRSDTQIVNGLTAYKLSATKSASSLFTSQSADDSLTVYWGVRAWVRHSNGVEQEISLDGQTGTPKAVVSRSTTGSGMQSNTVNVAQTTLQPTDSLVVRVYMKLGSGSWTLCATFTTEQLQATKLNGATWTVHYYTDRYWSRVTNRTTGKFYWGTATYNSRIQNLKYS